VVDGGLIVAEGDAIEADGGHCVADHVACEVGGGGCFGGALLARRCGRGGERSGRRRCF
jgi:hypothetical protein